MHIRRLLAMVVLCLVLGSAVVCAAAEQAKDAPIDWNKARQIYQKRQQGQALTAEERTYLQRAIAARAQGQMPPGKAGAATAQPNRPAAPPATQATGLIPLDQMTGQDRYKGEDGGLYGGGSNVPPAEHQKAADRELAKIVPLNEKGEPAADGKIVLISIGMSNTTMEFTRFKQLADADAAKSPAVLIVDCAQGGMDAERWSSPEMPAWKTLEQRLAAAHVTPLQVQAVWLKQARMGPARFGEWPKHGEELKGHILASLNLAKARFPNLRVAYLSSRIYAGYAATGLNPEPYAYEGGLVVRSLIQDQVKAEPKLNFDPARGEVKAPLLLWGPYLWADGMTPRKSDGLIWMRQDLAGDGTHPSPTSGRDKVARLLLDFMKTNPNSRGWFARDK